MRRHRPTHYSLTFLTVAAGFAAVPSTVGAGDEPVVPVDDAASAPEAAGAAPVDEPPAPPTAEAAPEPVTPDNPPATEPPATTPDESEPASPQTTSPATQPEPVPTTAVDASDIDPTNPSTEPTTTRAPVVERPEPTHTPEAKNDDDELDDDAFRALPDGVVRRISFPVLGPVRYANDWGNCRDGCSRRHVGTDMIGVRMQPLLAAVDGTVTRVRYENVGTAGSVITITGVDGWRYNYFHVNNDAPGTDDGIAGPEWQISPQVTLGSAVRAGQVIAYMGDSGNAEGSVPHVHFEIRQPDGTPMNPYQSLVAAQERQTCEVDEARISLSADATTFSADAATVIAIDGVGRWLIGTDGNLVAEGSAAYVAPVDGVDCVVVEQPTAPVRPAVVTEQVTAAVEPAPAVPADVPWIVKPGQSLWRISQEAYDVSEVAATVSAVNAVFDHNRDQLTDPNVLDVGMTLRLPPLAR